ncbi:MAG TPA: polysaccharide deacetylase family protein [bacterium]|nr:polysaccharide deacetylase family protein [bacterium]
MRVLICTGEYGEDGGGVARACQDLAELFSDADIAVAVAIVERSGEFDEGINVTQRVEIWGDLGSGLPIANGGYDPTLATRVGEQFFIKNLIKKASAWHPNICLSFGAGHTGLVASFIAKTLKIPLIVSLRGSDGNLVVGDAVKSAEFFMVLSEAEAVTGLSSELIEKARALLPRPYNPKFFVIPNPILLSVPCRHLPKKNKEFRLGCGARYLNEKKGVLSLIVALSYLKEREPCVDWQLELVGEIDPDLLDKYVSSIEDFGVKDHVQLLGYRKREDFGTLLEEWDLYVQASVCEGFSLSVVEALSHGTPILISDSGYIAESLRANHSELIVPSPDPRTLANSISTLYHAEKLETVAMRACDTLRPLLDPSAVQAQWLDILRSVALQSRAWNSQMRGFVPSIVLHDVGGLESTGVNVPVDIFGRTLKRIHEAGWVLCSAESFWASPDKSKKIVCTFDDGYEGVIQNALPVMDQYGFTATVFVVTKAIGTWNDWNPRDGFRRRHMSLDSLRTLREHGWEIGAHGMSHTNHLRLSEQEMRLEISGAKDFLQDYFGAVESYAYPYGAFNSVVVEVVRQYYFCAFALEHGGHHEVTDRYQLRRFTLREVGAFFQGYR